MPLERRTRITLLLPAPATYPQYLLVDQVLTNLVTVCGGVTHTPDIPPLIRGRWINENTRVTQYDELMLMIGDVRVSLTNQNLMLFLNNLKRRAQRDFSQDIIWVTVHEVYRLDTNDYVM